MTKQNKSVLSSNLNFIQLKLFDFSKQKINFQEILDEKLNKSLKLKNTDEKLVFDENNKLFYENSICPACNSIKIIKKGTLKREKVNIIGKAIKFSEQQYQCKKCDKKFGIKNNPFIKNNKHYLNEITDKIPDIMKNGYQSLRKIAKYFEIFLGIKISHQTIKNWITIDVKDRIKNKKQTYSGYYVYDEQFLRLNGVKHYRLLLYDAKLNIPVSEKIVKHRIPQTTETFIKESTKNKPFISLTTDLFPMYRNITDKLNVKHQLCKFHLFKTINHKIKVYCRKNKIKEKEKTQIYENARKLKEIFQQKSKKDSINHYKQYLKNFNTIPDVLKNFIKKHVINHFSRYIQHLNDENIPKTTNQAENYFRQTDPEKIKKKYKTKKGILSFLTYQMENWTEKHIKK